MPLLPALERMRKWILRSKPSWAKRKHYLKMENRNKFHEFIFAIVTTRFISNIFLDGIKK